MKVFHHHALMSALSIVFRLWMICSLFFAPGTAPAASAANLAAPGIPELTAPVDGEEIYATPQEPKALPIFRWNPVEGAASYDVQVSTTIGFNDGTRLYDLIKFPHDSFVPDIANLPDNTDLYWRVRAADIKGVYGSYSEIRLFRKNWLAKRINGSISENKPVLLLPEDFAVISFNDPTSDPSERPSFSWEPVLGATFYTLEFSLNPNFSPLYGDSFSTNSTSFQLPSKLPDNTYYWRVVPKMNGKVQATKDIWTGMPSDMRAVTFNYNQTHIPDLVLPLNNANLTFTPTFQWTIARGARYYVLQYSTSSAFPSTSETITVNTYATSFMPTRPLDNDKNYYWRVRAVSGESSAPVWSQPRQFFKKWYLNARLLTPTNGFPFVSEPYLSWTPVEGAVKYRIELSPTNSFSNPQKVTTSNTFHVDSLRTCPIAGVPGSVVFWRVIAIDNFGNEGEPSDHSRFDCNFGAEAPLQVYPHYYYPPHSAQVLMPHEDAKVVYPLLMWKRLLRSDGTQHAAYRVQVATDEYFDLTGSIVWTFDTQNMSAVPVSRSPIPAGEYYWRVRPLSSLTGGVELGQWSQVWMMSFDPNLQPAQSGTVAQLIRPVHASEWAETVPAFEWQPLQQASSYRVQISTSPDPASFEQAAFLKANAQVEYPLYTHPVRLPYGTYYWRVMALNASNAPLGAWSNIFRFQVAAQSRYRDARVIGENFTPIIATDPENDISDPGLDVSDLAVTEDRLGWYFNFKANIGSENMRYMLYIDVDHVDGSGGHVDPEGYNVTTIPAHQPEYVVTIYQMNGSFSLSNTWIYKWNKGLGVWDNRRIASGLAGSAMSYKDGRLELTLSGPNIGMGDESSTMAVALFTGRLETGFAAGPAQDTVPDDPNVRFTTPAPFSSSVVLSRFVSVTDRLSAIQPANTPAQDLNKVWTVPGLDWHAPVEVPLCGYQIRLGKDPLLTNWEYKPVKGSASSYTFDHDLKGDNTYFWEVRPYYFIGGACSFGGAWSEANSFVRKSPGPVGLFSTVEGNMIRLNWTMSEGANIYALQIDDDPDFTTPNYTELSLGVNSHTPDNELFNDGVTYYWRVKSIQHNSVEDSWSEISTFLIKRAVPSGTFTIPGTDPSHAMSENPTMCWKPEDTAYYYYVEVAYDDQFKTGYARFATEQSCYTYTGGMRDGTFFWRVALVDGLGGLSDFSLPQSYTKQYGAPVPLAPLGKADGTPLFVWTPVQGANKYRLEILNPYTGAVLKTRETAATSYRPLDKLNLKTYKWRVAILDNVKIPNAGPYSNEVLIQSSIYETFLPTLRK